MTAFAMLTDYIRSYTKAWHIIIMILALFPSYLFANEGLEIEIDNPKFSEKGLDNRLYEIKAEKGIQGENNLRLYIIEGKLRTNKGTWIYLNAKQGNFNQSQNLIELNGDIIFYSDENDEFQSDHALFSMNDDLVKFNTNVQHTKDNSIITSDKSLMKNNFDHIVYEGNVRVIYIID